MSETKAPANETRSAKSDDPSVHPVEDPVTRRDRTGADRLLRLHRTVGNQTVRRLLESGRIQAKLRIGAPNDACEQEADRIADQVMRMPAPAVQTKPG